MILSKVWVSEVTQSYLCDPMDCSLPGSSVHGIFQARVLDWGAISFSRGSSRPRDLTQFSHAVGRHFTVWATREAQKYKVKSILSLKKYCFRIQYTLIQASMNRKWQPTPVLLPGKFHGRRSLVGYNPRGRKESDTTERLQCQCQ